MKDVPYHQSFVFYGCPLAHGDKVGREGGIRSKRIEVLGSCDRDALNDNGESMLAFVANFRGAFHDIQTYRQTGPAMAQLC